MYEFRLDPESPTMREVAERLHHVHIWNDYVDREPVARALHDTLAVPRTLACPVGCLPVRRDTGYAMQQHHPRATIRDLVTFFKDNTLSPAVSRDARADLARALVACKLAPGDVDKPPE